ncbi:endonuclease/exonuclease/phosphatase family protein [Yoonia tamlensis]|nr:endonuclease/exonuclease/phosphatase family protein [Yoonia tamlensis]
MLWFRRLGALALLAACAGVALGFAGRLHPLGDSLSLLRMPLGVVCCLYLGFRLSAVLRFFALVAACAAFATTVPAMIGAPEGGALTVYSKNLLYRNDALAVLAADIRASGADVVTLQEVSHRNDAILKLLAAGYPYQHLCRFSGWSGVAVLSKTAFTAPARCSAQRGVAAAQIENGGQRLWVASVHLPWPYPYDHAGAADAAVALIAQLDGPVVLGGDFNIFPWAASARRIRQAAGSVLARPLRPTYSLYGVPLFLDHVAAPGGGHVVYRDLLGSDHRGVLATVRLAR